jgi:hypothetical protein
MKLQTQPCKHESSLCTFQLYSAIINKRLIIEQLLNRHLFLQRKSSSCLSRRTGLPSISRLSLLKIMQ